MRLPTTPAMKTRARSTPRFGDFPVSIPPPPPPPPPCHSFPPHVLLFPRRSHTHCDCLIGARSVALVNIDITAIHISLILLFMDRKSPGSALGEVVQDIPARQDHKKVCQALSHLLSPFGCSFFQCFQDATLCMHDPVLHWNINLFAQFLSSSFGELYVYNQCYLEFS
jgi:hypothetical protein